MSIQFVMIAAMVMQGIQQIRAGSQAKDAANQEALAAQQRGEENRLAGEQAALDAQVQANQRREENFSLYAANVASVGYDPYSSPSWLALKSHNDDEMNRDIDYLMFSGGDAQRAGQLGQRSENVSASAAKKRGQSAFRTGLLSAGSTFLKAGYQGSQLSAGSPSAGASAPTTAAPRPPGIH